MKSYFITATGTDIGKTFVTCALAHQLCVKGKSARAIKPVVSGFDASNIAASDSGLLLAAQGLPISPHSIEEISPWCFAAPISPDMAAEEEGSAIVFEQLIAFCRRTVNADYLLIEGAGGVMTPLGQGRTVLEWSAALNYPVILVTGTYLGSISHTLTSVRAMELAGVALHGVVVNESQLSPVPPVRMIKTLRQFLPPHMPIQLIPRVPSTERWKYAPDLVTSLCL